MIKKDKDKTYCDYRTKIYENYNLIIEYYCCLRLKENTNINYLQRFGNLISGNKGLCKDNMLDEYKNELRFYLENNAFENLKQSFYKFLKEHRDYVSYSDEFKDVPENREYILKHFQELPDFLKDLKIEDVKRYI